MDDSGRFDLAEHLRESAEHPFGSDHRRQLVGRLDTVQERQHHGFPPEQRLHRRRDFGYLPRLHRHHHEIDRADIGRIVGGDGPRKMHVAQGTRDLQAAFPDGPQVCPAGNERHVVAGARKTGSVVASEPSCTVNCGFSTATPPCRCLLRQSEGYYARRLAPMIRRIEPEYAGARGPVPA